MEASYPGVRLHSLLQRYSGIKVRFLPECVCLFLKSLERARSFSVANYRAVKLSLDNVSPERVHTLTRSPGST